MTSLRSLLLAGAACSVLVIPAGANEILRPDSGPILLAQAEGEAPAEGEAAAIEDPVALAEKAVADARAALREAMATGGDVEAARKALRVAQKKLKEVREAAGLPPTKDSDEAALEEGAPPAEATAPAEPPPDETVAETPPADTPPEEPPAVAETPAAEPTPDVAAEEPAPEATPEVAVEEPATEPKIAVIPRKKIGKPLLVKPKKPSLEEAEGAAAEEEAVAETPPAETTDTPETSSAETADVPEDAPEAEVATTEGDEPRIPRKLRKPKALEDVVVGAPPGTDEAPVKEPEVAAVKSGDKLQEGQAIEGAEGRIIVKEGGQVIIQHDDDIRFRRQGGKIDIQESPDGSSVTTVNRPNGIQIVTVRDPDGNIVQRFRKHRNGQIEILIGDEDFGRDAGPGKKVGPGKKPGQFAGRGRAPDFDYIRRLPPLRIQIAPRDYVLESEGASTQVIQEMLIAPPVEVVERPYTLEEIRRSGRLRAKLRRIDVDTVTFEFGQASVPEDQIPLLEDIGGALASVIENDPEQVFLIEGHTDAVGSDLANLSLSDRRAETVAEILTYYFDIPPENLITQGYGEQFLKVPTEAPERLNRRVTMRNITPLLRAEAQ